MPLSSDELEYVRRLVRSRSAIVLDEKDYLIESRLGVLADREGFESAAKLVQKARERSPGHAAGQKIVDALTTNETLFFRDVHPFDGLQRQIVPELIQRNAASRRLRIWCAACSTGQEPYSIAMLARTHFPELNEWRLEILATDLSAAALERARSGRFNQTEINRGLPAPMMVRFFEQWENEWVLAEAIRAMVQFRRRNLIEAWPEETPFDLIAVRNVMIYFDLATRAGILARLAARLSAGGYLMLGAAESPIGVSEAFAPVPVGKTVFFRKK